jgi:hypothetical protein
MRACDTGGIIGGRTFGQDLANVARDFGRYLAQGLANSNVARHKGCYFLPVLVKVVRDMVYWEFLRMIYY